MTETKEEYDETKIINTWEDCVSNDDLLRGIYGYGFEKPSVIQAKAIYPIAKCRRDIVAQAQSGTGKTGAFTIGALSVVDSNVNETQAIFLAPTHELANQTTTVCSSIGSHLPNFCTLTSVKNFLSASNFSSSLRTAK